MRLIIIYRSKPAHIILGIEPDADIASIRRAFRSLALQYHPDHNKSHDAETKMQEINAAYAEMKDGNYKYASGSGNTNSSYDFRAWSRSGNRTYNKDNETRRPGPQSTFYRKTRETWHWNLIDERLGHFIWEYKGVRKKARNTKTGELLDLDFHYIIRKTRDGMFVAREKNGTSDEIIDRFKTLINAAKSCAVYARSRHIIITQGEIPPVVNHTYDKEPDISVYDNDHLRSWEWRLLDRKQPLWTITLYGDLENPQHKRQTFYIARYPNGRFYVFNEKGRQWIDREYKTLDNAARACSQFLQKRNLIPPKVSHDFEAKNKVFDNLELTKTTWPGYPRLLRDLGFSEY